MRCSIVNMYKPSILSIPHLWKAPYLSHHHINIIPLLWTPRDSSHRDLAGFEPRTCSHGNPRVSSREAKRSLCSCRTCPPEVAGPVSNGTSGSVEKIHFRGPCQLKHWKLVACRKNPLSRHFEAPAS